MHPGGAETGSVKSVRMDMELPPSMCAVIVGTNLMRAYQRVGEQRVDNSIVKKHGNEAMDLQLSGLRPDNGSQVESAGQGNCEASIGTERMDTLLPFNRGGRGDWNSWIGGDKENCVACYGGSGKGRIYEQRCLLEEVFYRKGLIYQQ